MASSDGISDASGLSRGNPGLGGADDPALTPTSPSGTDRRMNRRVTRALKGSHHGLGGPRRMVFLNKPKELSHGRLAFISEIFKIKGTIVLKVVPQIILAAFVGLFANLVKVLYCGEGVAATMSATSRFMDGHLGVSVVLSFYSSSADLVQAILQGKSALGAIHTGIRNLNVATVTFGATRFAEQG